MGGVGNVRVPQPSYAWSSAHRANAVSQAGRRSLGFRFSEESVHLGRPRRKPKHWSKTRNGSRITSASALTSCPPLRKRNVPIAVSRSFFRVFSSAFRGRRAPGGWRVQRVSRGVASVNGVGVASSEWGGTSAEWVGPKLLWPNSARPAPRGGAGRPAGPGRAGQGRGGAGKQPRGVARRQAPLPPLGGQLARVWRSAVARGDREATGSGWVPGGVPLGRAGSRASRCPRPSAVRLPLSDHPSGVRPAGMPDPPGAPPPALAGRG